MAKKVYFVDLDNTLNKFPAVFNEEDLYEEHFFLRATARDNVVEAVNRIAKECPVYILSAYPMNSKYAVAEKLEWVRRKLENIQDVLLVPEGESKVEAAKVLLNRELCKEDILFDDYTSNLMEWDNAGGKGIKLIHQYNGSGIRWPGERVLAASSADAICRALHG